MAGPDEPELTIDDGANQDPESTLPTLPGEAAFDRTLDDQASRNRADEFLSDPELQVTQVRPAKRAPMEVLGQYELVRELGRGAMGVVYEAVDTGSGKTVAVKVLPPGLAQSDAAKQRFIREGEAMAALRHPNILPVYGLGEDKNTIFYSMAIVSGRSLRDVIDQEGLKIRDAARFIRDSAAALDYAHDAGVIHRDIKPANLLIEPDDSGGTVLVADFGIAKSADHATLTASGTIMGTPMYMSPEQAKGETSALDGRSDVYSLGATLYECLTRAKPYTGDDVQTILRHVIETDPPAPRRINPDVPKALEAICFKSMEKRRDRRYVTAGELAEDCDRYLKGQAVQARVRGPIARTMRWAGRHKAAAALIVLVTLGTLGGGGTFGYLQWSHARKVNAALDGASDALVAGKLDDARRQFDLALALEPGSSQAKAGLKTVDDKRTAEAVEAARARITAALAAAGEALEAGHVDDARAKYQLVDQLDPGNPAAKAAIASIAARQRELAARKTRAAAAALTDQADAAMKAAQGSIAGLQKAEALALRAIETDPAYEPAREVRVIIALARAHVEIGRKRYEDARIYLALAREAAGPDPDAIAELDRLDRVVAGTGTLTVFSKPVGARVELARADPVSGLYGSPELLGDTPIDSRDLPMGSYLLVMRKSGFAPARWPFVITRNADVAPSIPMVPLGLVPAGMVHVPAGASLIGDPVSGPMQGVELPAFLVDRTEVTREAYAQFLTQLQASDPDAYRQSLSVNTRTGKPVWEPATLEKIRQEDGANVPVVGITWHAATAFANWRNARLPSSREWERAARGADGRLFPWGHRFDVARANCMESKLGPKVLQAESYPTGASPFGCLNMAGNVSEFTADLVDTIEIMGRVREIIEARGGGCASNTHALMAPVGLTYSKAKRSLAVGFRCVVDLPKPYGGAK